MTISQNPEACCNQNCRSGRDCPNRQPRDLTKWERGIGLVLLAVLSWGLCAMLSGCQKAEAVATQSAAMPNGVLVYRDQDTGCEYLTTVHENGITPRIAADGKTHMGCREVAK